MFWEIRIHPYFHFSLLSKENHLFCDIEIPNLLIEYFEALQAALIKIELIIDGDIIDLFKS